MSTPTDLTKITDPLERARAARDAARLVMEAAPELLAICRRTRDWFLEAAKRSDEHAAQVERFPSLADAERHDAKNYRATARRIDEVIAKAEGR